MTTEHRSSPWVPHQPKVARNSDARTFCSTPKRCNSNDAISMFEIHVGELRATFLRNHNMRCHKDPSRRQPKQKTPATPTAATTATSTGALHPLRDHAPDQGHYTRSEEVQCLRIGCSAPINKNKRGIDRSIDATTTSKLHEGRRRVELNLEISRHANPLLFGGCRATADPGCGARGRRRGLAGLRTDAPSL